MTATHARPGLAGRLAGLLRRCQPDLYPIRTADYGDGPKIIGFWDDLRPAGPVLAYDEDMDPGSHDHPTWIEETTERAESHPPWVTAPQPACPPPRPASFPAGPGTLDVLYAAAARRDQRTAEFDAWYEWGASLDVPDGLVRPYAPENEPAPLPEPAVVFPVPDLYADLDGCPLFRDAVRGSLVRREHAQGRRPQAGETWLGEYARVYREQFTGALDDIVRRAMAAPYPDFNLAEVTA